MFHAPEFNYNLNQRQRKMRAMSDACVEFTLSAFDGDVYDGNIQ